MPISVHSQFPQSLAQYAFACFRPLPVPAVPGGLALPVISNQRMNEYLKDLCEFCEINEPVSRSLVRAGQREEESRPKYELVGTHAGRRTFICFALASGIPPQVVMNH